MATLDALIEQTDVPQTISYSPYAYEVSAAVAFGLYAMVRGSKRNSQRTAQNRAARRRTWLISQRDRKDHLSVRNDDPHNQLVAYVHAQHYGDQPGFRPALYHPQPNPYAAVDSDVTHWYDTAVAKAGSLGRWFFSYDTLPGYPNTHDTINDLHPENVKRSLVAAGIVLGAAALLSSGLWYLLTAYMDSSPQQNNAQQEIPIVLK